MEEENELIQPDVVEEKEEQRFPAPFGYPFGTSSIDLSIKSNEDNMLEEYKNYRSYGRERSIQSLGFPYTREDAKEERNKLRDNFYNKYFGMNHEDYLNANIEHRKNDPNSGFYPGANRPIESMKKNFEALSIPGLAWADFFNDAAGTLIPGYNKFDDRWDEATKLDSKAYQQIRKVLSVVLPAIQSGKVTAGGLQKLPVTMPWFQKALIGTGAFSAQEAAIIGLSDLGEEDNIPGMLANTYPELFGGNGRVPLPEWLKTMDTDSPSVRKKKNMYDTAGLSAFGSVLGAALKFGGAKGFMEWMVPLDDASKNYKQLELFKISDSVEPEKIIRLKKIDELLSTKQLSKQNENILINEKLNLEEELGVIVNPDDFIKRDIDTRGIETDLAQQRKIATSNGQLDLFDVDLTPGMIDESGEARQTIPPGNVAKNMADTTAIKNGTSTGDPAPIITESMRSKGLMVGDTSRGAVMGVAEETRALGRFDALVDGFRYNNKQMNAAAWDIYTSIIQPGSSLDDIKQIFYENRDVKNLLLGRFKVEYINEETARAAAFALRDLTDQFLGREVSEASARVMDTLGREASTIAETIKDMKPYVDDNRAMDLIIDKMEFLLDEYALNKYISGWSLRNKNWFDQIPPKELNTVIEQLTEEFTSAQNAIHAKNARFTKTLKDLKVNNPLALRPLVDAFAHTDGDVDTLAKLYEWAAKQITPLGLIKSPDPKQMNLFAKGMWGVRYNNVLSGLSAARALVGNTSQLITRPITALLGHGLTGNLDGVQRTLYYSSALYATNVRALKDGLKMMKKTHQDPTLMAKTFRKDFIIKEDKAWKIMDEMEGVYKQDRNFGRLAQLRVAKTLNDLGKNRHLRYGMTGLVFPDAFTATHLAHHVSRVRAYDDVVSEFGYFKPEAIMKAEVEHYKTMFDADGLIKDDVLKSITGEISLNLNDGLSNYINEGTTAYPILKDLMMFPRTSSNWIKNSASWTPIQAIPGINKYSKTIWARTDDEIATALAEHGIDFATTPNAKVIFQNLKAEYIGRMAFSGLLVGTLHQYAMTGNIRGNGHYNASRRKKERDEMGYDPKTINIFGKWISYKGLIGIEQVLSILGDIAYYRSDLDQALLEDWHAKLAWTISATFLNETPLEGLEPLIAALNGDLSGWNRLVANSARSYLPLSGGAGVVAKAIDSAQKDLDGSIKQYIQNRIPLYNTGLANRVDIWTGESLNDIDNPILRVLNALNPFGVSGTNEPWRQWLLETNWDGISMIKKHSSGNYEYTPEERELIYGFIGEQKPYKKVQKLMNNKGYNEDLKQIKAFRNSRGSVDKDALELKTSQLPVYRALRKILRDAQINAEVKLNTLALEQPDEYGHIPRFINRQGMVKGAMKSGNVPRAVDLYNQEESDNNRKLIEYGNN